MKLSKFDKYSKKKSYIIGAIAVVFVSIIGIVLYRSYALYQEKQSYNVLKGKIPDFNNGDLQLAIKVNGEVATTIPAKGEYNNVTVDCGDAATGEWDYDAWGVKVTNINSPKVSCVINFSNSFITAVKLGDYVKMTPTSTSYTIEGTKTGCAENSNKCKNQSNQTINPSELNIWQVIDIKGDGTVEVISKNVSSTDVYFYGKTGYKNLVGTLNEIARQYKNDKYTKDSRHMGYDGQTEYIANEGYFTIPAPATQSTEEICQNGQACSIYEGYLGDIKYTADVNLVNNTLKTLVANKQGTSKAADYWLASRAYAYLTPDEYYWGGRIVFSSGQLVEDNDFIYIGMYGPLFYNYANDPDDWVWESSGISKAIRPILTLKSGIEASSGSGTNENPWVLE